nr:hypothetical protein Q903MT_gene4544 [Picea sitchensis]
MAMFLSLLCSAPPLTELTGLSLLLVPPPPSSNARIR